MIFAKNDLNHHLQYTEYCAGRDNEAKVILIDERVKYCKSVITPRSSDHNKPKFAYTYAKSHLRVNYAPAFKPVTMNNNSTSHL